MVFLAYKLADTTLLALIGGLALILAFVKINGQAFHYFLLNIFQTLRRPSRRVWYKFYTSNELNVLRKEGEVPVTEKIPEVQKASYNRIRDLSLLVNTGGYYKPE